MTGWAVAVATTLAALALAAQLDLPAVALLGSAVVVSAWYGGRGAGLVATVLGAVLAWIGADIGAMGVFAAVGQGLLASVLIGALWEASTAELDARSATGAAVAGGAAVGAGPAAERVVAATADDASGTVVHRAASEPSQRDEAAASPVHATGEFLGVLSHELRNPLGALRNALRVMATGQRQEEALELSQRQVERLTALVDGLLDVSRIARGSLGMEPEMVDVGTLLDGVAETVRPGLAAHGKVLHVEPPSAPLGVSADPKRLRSVLRSLLDNAAQHTSDGGNVWISARRDGRDAVLVVRDDGAGMATEVIDEVFDAFRPHHGEPHRRRGGLGIGLAVVRAVARLHGGDAEVQSAGPGHGTTVTVRLPALPDS